MIAEVSFPSTGLGIELPWADSFECPIICIHRKGSKISNSLKIICKNFIEYTSQEDLIKQISNLLEKLWN